MVFAVDICSVLLHRWENEIPWRHQNSTYIGLVKIKESKMFLELISLALFIIIIKKWLSKRWLAYVQTKKMPETGYFTMAMTVSIIVVKKRLNKMIDTCLNKEMPENWFFHAQECLITNVLK